MTTKVRILIAEHNKRRREILGRTLSADLKRKSITAECVSAETISQAKTLLTESKFDVAITDWMWPAEHQGQSKEDVVGGPHIAGRAKEEDVGLVIVVTRMSDAADSARLHKAVDCVITWDELTGGGEPLVSAICERTGVSMINTPGVNPREIFVVHGHNHKALDAFTSFAEDLDLIVLGFVDARRAALAEMRQAGRPLTTLDVVTYGTSAVSAVVVLLTPDEAVTAASEAGSSPPRLQPRPNVIFEAGLAYGKLPARTLMVKVGNVEAWSDVEGVQYATFSNDPRQREELVGWLEAFGLPVARNRKKWASKDYGLEV